jgi:hypothetical protein
MCRYIILVLDGNQKNKKIKMIILVCNYFKTHIDNIFKDICIHLHDGQDIFLVLSLVFVACFYHVYYVTGFDELYLID